MKAFIFAAGSDGDIHPHLGLASELVARGHEVVFLTSFDYLDLARSCGFEALSIIDVDDRGDFESVRNFNPIEKLRSRAGFFARKVRDLCDLVTPRLDKRSILISPPFAAPTAKLLHLRHDIPYVSTVLSPASLCSVRNPPAFKSGEWFASLPWPARQLLFRGAESLLIDPGFRWLMRDLLHTMDVPKPHRVLSKWAYSPQRILGLFAEWFCPTAQDWPAQLVLTSFPLYHPRADADPLPAGLKSFLDSGPAPILFTAGTEAKTVRTFFDIALHTTQRLGSRAIFLTRRGDQLPTLPANIHYSSYASLRALLPRTAAIVHHGGIGTAAQAMRAGNPQLILPGCLDQFDNAQHVEALGCGLVEKNPSNNAGATDKLRRLLRSPEIAHACRTVRSRIASGPAACSRAVDVIEEVWHSTRITPHSR